MIAVVAGATGLVGGHLARRLAGEGAYDEVVALTRRPVDPGLRSAGVREVIVDFDRLEDHVSDLAATHVFCALGTTMRTAGSREAFRRVDLDYPLSLARVARAGGARHFSLVSSVGADPASRVFYTRTKGEVEEGVREVGYPSGAIFRPSMLGGERTESRPLERIGQRLFALLPGRYRVVDADAVARAMIEVARLEEPGWRVVESEEIRAIARPGG